MPYWSPLRQRYGCPFRPSRAGWNADETPPPGTTSASARSRTPTSSRQTSFRVTRSGFPERITVAATAVDRPVKQPAIPLLQRFNWSTRTGAGGVPAGPDAAGTGATGVDPVVVTHAARHTAKQTTTTHGPRCGRSAISASPARASRWVYSTAERWS